MDQSLTPCLVDSTQASGGVVPVAHFRRHKEGGLYRVIPVPISTSCT